MNKLFLFDLDGVLIDSRELHYEALNDALNLYSSDYVISREEHLSIYDGLSTTKKLELLTKNKGLSTSLYNNIWELKQRKTFDLIEKKFRHNPKIWKMFNQIKTKGYKIAVASNSVRETVKLSLLKIGVMEFVDYYVSNEDVKRHKPYPEMYWKCMIAMNALPRDTVIFEDSHIGRQGALDSGAHLIPIKDTNDMTQEKIEDAYDVLQGIKKKNVQWRDKKMNVLIPMAGAGSRFAQAGYTFPKPLIEVHGKPMIQVVVENLNIDAHFIYVCQQEHYDKYNLKQLLNLITPGCDIIPISPSTSYVTSTVGKRIFINENGLTEGAACTTLVASKLIDNDSPLLFSNSDQFIEWNSNEVLYAFTADGVDGGILTFEGTHPKWSFAKIGSDGFVSEVAEKNPISNLATCGVYYWAKGRDYVRYAREMIDKNIRVNNEFYVAPVYNQAIQDGKKIRTKNIDKMWGLGTPSDLEYFIRNYKGEI